MFDDIFFIFGLLGASICWAAVKIFNGQDLRFPLELRSMAFSLFMFVSVILSTKRLLAILVTTWKSYPSPN